MPGFLIRKTMPDVIGIQDSSLEVDDSLVEYNKIGRKSNKIRNEVVWAKDDR